MILKNKKTILKVLGTLKRFLKERGLILNTEKNEGDNFQQEWKGKERKIDLEDSNFSIFSIFKYLDFTFNRGDYKEHIKKLKKKDTIRFGIWDLEEKIYKEFLKRW